MTRDFHDGKQVFCKKISFFTSKKVLNYNFSYNFNGIPYKFLKYGASCYHNKIVGYCSCQLPGLV